MRTMLILFLLGALAFTVPQAMALQMPIYEGEVALESGEDESSERALRQSLVQVLVKVSGDRSIVHDPTLATALGEARRIALTIARKPGSAADGVQRLVVNFDPGRVHDLLGALGRPVWHGDRAPLLVWLAIDDGVQKQIANANQIAALGAITGTAQMRGVPTLLPRMDGVDQNRINPVTLWSAPPQTVIAAGQRYGVSTMLVIRLTRGTPWRARCTLIDGRSVESWEQDDALSNNLLAAAIDGAADRLARRYAVEPEGTAIGAVDWWVEGITSARDYAAVVGYLGGLEFVRSAHPVRAENGRLLLRLDLGVGTRRLRQLLAIDGTLTLVDASGDDIGGSPSLRLVH